MNILFVSNIPWSEEPHAYLVERLKCSKDEILNVELLKRSVDGRRRPPLWLANYRVEVVSSELAQKIINTKPHGVRLFTERDEKRYQKRDFTIKEEHRWSSSKVPIVIGAGPAGLFAALRFAEAGAPAIVFERGGDVKDRHVKVRQFWRHHELDLESNVVFGEGGAGAFSDGKIYTRKRDGELGWVFQRLVDFGADPEILEEGWAHLGTDKIRAILPNIRAYCIEKGVTFRFHSCVKELIVESDRCVGVTLADDERVFGSPVIVATGHSARDSWHMMLDAGAEAELRPIRIGARIEHPQKLIDLARYGQERGELPAASYRLVSKPKNGRGAHTFCMCPGGTVVGATAQQDRIVVNGMSYSGRRAFWANSAIIVQVNPEDYESEDPLAGVRFQDRIERKAFELTGEGFAAPAQKVVDFLNKRKSTELPRSSYPQGIVSVDMWELFPLAIAEGLKQAILDFDRKIKGFAGAEAVLIAPETRTSAPIRFLRDEKMFSTTLSGMMPIGEGAGYAGGIASAALEGFQAVESVLMGQNS